MDSTKFNAVVAESKASSGINLATLIVAEVGRELSTIKIGDFKPVTSLSKILKTAHILKSSAASLLVADVQSKLEVLRSQLDSQTLNKREEEKLIEDFSDYITSRLREILTRFAANVPLAPILSKGLPTPETVEQQQDRRLKEFELIFMGELILNANGRWVSAKKNGAKAALIESEKEKCGERLDGKTISEDLHVAKERKVARDRSGLTSSRNSRW